MMRSLNLSKYVLVHCWCKELMLIVKYEYAQTIRKSAADPPDRAFPSVPHIVKQESLLSVSIGDCKQIAGTVICWFAVYHNVLVCIGSGVLTRNTSLLPCHRFVGACSVHRRIARVEVRPVRPAGTHAHQSDPVVACVFWTCTAHWK